MRPLALALVLVWLVPGAAAQSGAAPLTVRHSARSLQPGEVVLLTASGPAGLEALEAEVFDRRFEFFRQGARRWECLIGIDLDVRPGAYTVKVRGRTAGSGPVAADYPLAISRKAFPERRLSVEEKYVTPPADTLERIRKETELLRGLLARTTPDRLWDGPFVLPVPGPAISGFGRRSILNGQPRSPHAGTDFRAATGTPIEAPNRGRVVLAGNLYFSGNTVLLDHGMGLYSYFGHLSRILVAEGDVVERGSVLGKVGATGRVTGPHLHWSVRLAETRVDPMSLVAVLRASSRP